MDNANEKCEVPLPSATHEQQSLFEKQSLVKTPQVADTESKDNETSGEKVDTHSVNSESDNEIVAEEFDSGEKASTNVNIDDEFEKILTPKIDNLASDESTESVDQEIIEILSEKAPGNESLTSDATIINIAQADTIESEKNIKESVAEQEAKIDTTEEKLEIIAELNKEQEEEKVSLVPVEAPLEYEQLASEIETEKSTSQIDCTPDAVDNAQTTDEIKSEKIEPNESVIDDTKPRETFIDEYLLSREGILKSIADAAEKPPVPIQTYLWEDIKRSKEQGGYPWTHIYKQPLGPNEEPEVILNYKRSPKSGRKLFSHAGTLERSETPESPKSQKKVRIQDEIEVKETENYIQDLENEEEKQNDDGDEACSDANVEANVGNIEQQEASAEVKKSPKSILKRSQKILHNITPNTSKFDSGSLKKKIKTPLNKIKKMADHGIQKVKNTKIKTIPIKKDQIVLNEEVKILKLKESPKSNHREHAAYIVKQDSDDTIDIVELEESPSESRRKTKTDEGGIVTPDEIIELPVSTETNTKITDSCKNEIDLKEKSPGIKEERPTSKENTPSRFKKEHVYEDIEDYVSKIAFDSEHVNRVSVHPEKHENKLQRQDKINIINDPIFDEFSRELNKQIRKSLTAQDDNIRQELSRKIPKIEELEKQISDEDKEEKTDDSVKSPHLLAPISSIDSTSSDEERRAQLSIVVEESEASDSLKKKSFDEPSVDILDVESLKVDESDVSTIIEDEKTPNTDNEVIEAPQELEISQNLEANKKNESPERVENDQNVKEDIQIKDALDAPTKIKISSKWSKMRIPTKDLKVSKGQFKLKKIFNRCFSIA